jgi:hypothetical protein
MDSREVVLGSRTMEDFRTILQQQEQSYDKGALQDTKRRANH